MNPSLCTVVILHQPYIIHDHETYQQLFSSYFGQGKQEINNKKRKFYLPLYSDCTA